MSTDIPPDFNLNTTLFAGLTVSGGERRRCRAAVWADALDWWLVERRVRSGAQAAQEGEVAWQLIYEHLDRLPWELTRLDIEKHAAWMEVQGVPPEEACRLLGALDEFYEWTIRRQMDAECPEDFNPAAGMRLPPVTLEPEPQTQSRWDLPADLQAALDSPLEGDLMGMRDEVAGLRRLGRALLALESRAASVSDLTRLVGAYTLTAARIAAILDAQKDAAEDTTVSDRHAWAEDMLEMLDRAAVDFGFEPPGEETRREAAAQANTGDDGLGFEIAATRHVLQSILRLVDPSVASGNLDETIRLSEVYGLSCSRLMRMLRLNVTGVDPLADYLEAQIAAVIEQITSEWPIVKQFRALGLCDPPRASPRSSR